MADIRFPEPAPCGKTPIEAKDISKAYGSNIVFAGVNLAIDKGSRVVILGYNGAGKTTTLRLLAHLESRTPAWSNMAMARKLAISPRSTTPWI